MVRFLFAIALWIPVAGCNLLSPAVSGVEDPVSAPHELPLIPDPSPEAAEVPQGYRVEVALSGLTYPSSIEFDDQGRMLVAEAGYVYGDGAAPARILRIGDNGTPTVLADQLNGPVTDILWHQGRLYISHRGKISVLEGGAGRAVRDLVTGLPSLGDHHNNQLAAGPDGKIYFGQGTVTNSGVVGIDNFMFLWLHLYPDLADVPARDIELTGETFLTINPLMLGTSSEPKLVRTAAFRKFGDGNPKDNIVRGQVKANGTVLRMNPDGSQLEVYAWGLRNPFGLAWGRDGELYVADNGYDERGSRAVANAPDFLWKIRPGAWYGFPDFVGGIPITDERFRPKMGAAPTFLLKDHPPVEKPLLERPPHAAVCKLDVAPREFGFDGQLFLAEIGDAAPITGEVAEPVGHQVVRIDPAGRESRVFFRARKEALGPRDMEYVRTAGPKRPIDVRFHGGVLYVVDLGVLTIYKTAVPWPQPVVGTGTIWRISPERISGAPDREKGAGQ